jgi:polysaccharide pyruvyl transferase WcaK-like protein
MLNKPILAISNHVKVNTLMNELGLSEYCVEADKCNSNLLAGTFVSLVSNRDEIKSRMAEKLASYKEKLSNQFDELFPSEARSSVRKSSSHVGAAYCEPPVPPELGR